MYALYIEIRLYVHNNCSCVRSLTHITHTHMQKGEQVVLCVHLAKNNKTRLHVAMCALCAN